MKSPREIKEEKVQAFKDHLDGSKAVILTDYKGVTVHSMEELRGKLREAGGHVSIIKNTLAKVALKDLGIDSLDEDLNGQIAFVFSKEDAVSGTKAAHAFTKTHDKFEIVSGFFDGKRISIDEVKALASMPSRDELRSKFVGILIAPMGDIIGTLQAPLPEFIGTLEAYAKKLEEPEAA